MRTHITPRLKLINLLIFDVVVTKQLRGAGTHSCVRECACCRSKNALLALLLLIVGIYQALSIFLFGVPSLDSFLTKANHDRPPRALAPRAAALELPHRRVVVVAADAAQQLAAAHNKVLDVGAHAHARLERGQ